MNRRRCAQGARGVVSTYNEPLITAEWAVAVFREAKAAGLTTGFVSNGNATPEVLEYIRPWVDLYKVDLKSFDDRRYHELGGRIGPILDSIRRIHEMGFWLEVVTLVDSRVQRLGCGTGRDGRISGGNFAGYSLARHRVPQGLQNDGAGGYAAGDAGAGGRDRRAAGLRYRVCRKSAGLDRRAGEHALPRVRGPRLIERRGFRVLRNRLARGRVSRIAARRFRACGPKTPRADARTIPAWCTFAAGDE